MEHLARNTTKGGASAFTEAFPQAETAAHFPAAVHDLLNLQDLLTTEERALVAKVRSFMVRHLMFVTSSCSLSNAPLSGMQHRHGIWPSFSIYSIILLLSQESEVAPVITDYWERAEFPFPLLPKLAALGLGGATIKGYGCSGLGILAHGLAAAEMARVDASVATFSLVHNFLALLTVGLLVGAGCMQQHRHALPCCGLLYKEGFAFSI